MNKVMKKLSAGLLACFIAVMGVLAIGTGAYAAGPCAGVTNADNTAAAKNPFECSACIGSRIAEGQSKDEALRRCQSDADLTMDNVWGMVWTIINWVLIVVGIICVVFIIIGGIRYATSGGDPEKVKSAKNTILYALIGLVIAILANVIVQVVFSVTGLIANPGA